MSATLRVRSVSMPSDVFVISDLHIGGTYGTNAGERGFRINTHVDQLVNFIDQVRQRAQRAGARTELVINGDFVDFLAEEAPSKNEWRAFISDQDEAVAAFDEIAKRDAAFFEALRSLLESGVRLTVVLGNHDVELSLPRVRSRLRSVLGADSCRPFKFVYDGEAYVIGDALIEHGNRYDGWNVVDHDRLRRHRSEHSRRLPTSDDATFEPPAGSRLVERVMNPIKKDYAFVDLLKPETEAAIPFLLALEPGYFWDIEMIEIARLRSESQKHDPASPARPAFPGDISSVGAASRRASLSEDVVSWRSAEQMRPEAAPQNTRVIEDLLAQRLTEAGREGLVALVEQAEREMQSRASDIAGGGLKRVLSFAKLLTTKGLEGRLPSLLDALRVLQDDHSFDRAVETGQNYIGAARELATRGFSTVVFGHTHLAKEIELEGGGKYLNTGTWADLIRVPPEIIHDDAETAMAHLRRFVDAVRTNRFDDYIEFLPTFAHIKLDQDGRVVSARVRDFVPGGVKEL